MYGVIAVMHRNLLSRVSVYMGGPPWIDSALLALIPKPRVALAIEWDGALRRRYSTTNTEWAPFLQALIWIHSRKKVLRQHSVICQVRVQKRSETQPCSSRLITR